MKNKNLYIRRLRSRYLLAYLIIKGKPQGITNEDELNWKQFCGITNKKTNLQFIDNSLQDLTKFLILKNEFYETPSIIQTKIYSLPKQIRKNCHKSFENLESLNEAIQRRKFANDQRREIEKEIERKARKSIGSYQKCRQHLEFD
jgi:hypothetical protein